MGASAFGAVFALLSPRFLGQANRWRRASKGERFTYLLFGLLGLGFWVGIFLLFGWLVGAFHSVEIFGPILSRKLLEILLLGLFGLLCFSNVVTALSTFYLSDDLELVLSLPVSRTGFHFARLADTIAQSSWMLAFFGLPVFAAYGWAYQAGWPYVFAVLAAMPGFVLMPAAFGLVVATTLVRVFPARKVREALVLLGIAMLVVSVVGLRVIRPERLADAESFESVAAYVADLQAPVPILAPPRWASELLLAALMDRPFAWMQLALLLLGGIATTGIARWMTNAFYDEGRARAQEARAARLARSVGLDRVLAVFVRPLPPVARAIVIKDIKVFIRDPSQWSQVFLVGSIVVITVASIWAMPMDMFRGPWAPFWKNFFAFGAHSLVGFIMAAVAARFQFTAVSTERRGFWLVRTAPITAREYLWAKLWPGVIPMILVGETLAAAATLILGASPFLIVISMATAFGLGFAISGFAIGLGAVYPDFKADNAARVASGPAGVLFMVLSLLLTFVVVLLEAGPVVLLLRAVVDERPLLAWEWVGVIVPLLLVAAVCVAGTVLPLRHGAKKLWERELPNS